MFVTGTVFSCNESLSNVQGIIYVCIARIATSLTPKHLSYTIHPINMTTLTTLMASIIRRNRTKTNTINLTFLF